MTYPYCADRELEPPDPMADVLADEAREQAEEYAWRALFEDGDQVPILDDYVSEDMGEAFDLVKAYRSGGDLTEPARKMAVKLEGVMEGYLE